MKTESSQTIVYRGSPGMVAGILGCVFGVLGIFTVELIFVPLAAVCSVVGLARGFGFPGFGVSVIGSVLTIIGAVTSPTVLLMLGISLISTNAPYISTTPSTSTKVPVVKQTRDSLISCGSAGCFPMDDSPAARAAAAAANEQNAREAAKIRANAK
jgi:hypothetical protein